MVVLSTLRPALAAGASVEVVLSTTSVAAAPALDLASGLTGHAFVVAMTGSGGATRTFDVLDALGDALRAGTASYWQRGPLATGARVEIPLDGTQRLVFDVTTFQGGGFSVEASFNNDRAMEAGGRATYDVSVTMDGALVAQESVSQGLYQNWHRSFASGTDGGQGLGDASGGWLNIRHDIAHLQETGAIAEYELSGGIADTLLDAYAAAMARPGWGDPLAANDVAQYMPGVGGRADIGFTTAANTSWLISQDMRAAQYAMAQAEVAGAVPWNLWDARNGSWLGTDDYPRLWTDYRGGTGRAGDPNATGLTQQTDGNTGWSLDPAHQPDLSYVPYLLTGQRWMLDNLQAQGAWNIMAQWPLARGDGDDLVVRDNQVRGAAWALRQIDEAAWISPDGSPEKAYFTQASEANWSWIVDQIPTWTAQQGEAHGWLPGVYGAEGALPAWQQDYFASTAIAAVGHGNADARTYLEWASNFLVGRFTHAAQGFAEHDGAAYLIAIGDPVTGTPYTTWAQIGAETAARGWSNGTGWAQSQGDYAQLALATLAGIAEVTGSAAAVQAYRDLVADSPPFTAASDFARDPTYWLEAPGTNSVPPPPSPLPRPPPAPPSPLPADPAGVVALSITLGAESWDGDPFAVVLVDDREVFRGEVSAGHASGGMALALGNHAADVAHVVTVSFLNDAWGGTAATDRNLHVEDLRVDGVSTGDSAILYATGEARFLIPTEQQRATGGGDDIIRIGVSEDAWLGHARYVVLLDGVEVASREATASHARGESTIIEVRADLPPGAHALTMRFLNDAWGGTPDTDRNLYVDSVSVNGVDLGQHAVLKWTGDAAFLVGQGSGTQGGAPAEGGDALRIAVSADAWEGDPLFIILVDGVPVGEARAVTASHATGAVEQLDVGLDLGAGPHVVGVRFLNDAYGGTPDRDRNLYVESISVNGVDLHATATLLSAGDAVFPL